MNATQLTSIFALTVCVALVGCGDDAPIVDRDAGMDAGDTVPPPDFTAGAACSTAADCGSNGSGACLDGFEHFAETFSVPGPQPIIQVGLRVPGGYCSNNFTCETDADCGPGGGCYKPIDGASDTGDLHSAAITDLNATGVCLKTCTASSDCRQADGYACEVPLTTDLYMVSDRPMDTYCVRAQALPCDVTTDVVPAGKCHLEYDIVSDFQITDTLAGQGDVTRTVGPGVLILEVDRAAASDAPSVADGPVGVSCYYNDQRMEVAGVFTAVEQIAVGMNPLPTGAYASATGIVDMTSNCAYDASYGQSTASWTPSATVTGTSCIHDFWSVGDVNCSLGPACSIGSLVGGHNPQDATWDQPWNNLVLDNGAGDWSAISMAGDGAPDLWAPLLACMSPPLDVALAGPPAADLMGGAVHCEDPTTWVDGNDAPILAANGVDILPGMAEEHECYRLHCMHPTDKVEVPNATPSRTFTNFAGTLVQTRCTPP